MSVIEECNRKEEEKPLGGARFVMKCLKSNWEGEKNLETLQKGRPTMVQTEANFSFFKSPWTQIFLICVWSKV